MSVKFLIPTFSQGGEEQTSDSADNFCAFLSMLMGCLRTLTPTACNVPVCDYTEDFADPNNKNIGLLWGFFEVWFQSVQTKYSYMGELFIKIPK